MDGLDPNYGTLYLVRRELRIDEAEHKRIRKKVEADVANFQGEIEVLPPVTAPERLVRPVLWKEAMYDG